MRKSVASGWVIALLVVGGCATSPDSGAEGVGVGGGKADAFGFELGIYSSGGAYDDGGPAPILAAFHDAAEGLRDGYAGHFDLAIYDVNEDVTTLLSGIFKLFVEDDQTTILLEGYDGQVVGRYPWSYADGALRLGEHELSRLHQSSEEEILGECEAFQVLEYELEESFTPWEYPSVSIERKAEGGYEVWLGSSSFESGEDAIEVGTNEAGELEARITTSYGNLFLVQIPKANPSRGRVLSGDEGEEPHLMANLVCYPPAAEPAAPAETRTRFTCTTRRADPNGEIATIRFGVVDLENPEAMALSWPEDVEEPIAVEPETSYAHTLVGGIADGYLRYEDGKLRIFSDQTGYEFGTLELYENSGFQRGYFRFEMMDPDNTSFYTEVDCVLE